MRRLAALAIALLAVTWAVPDVAPADVLVPAGSTSRGLTVVADDVRVEGTVRGDVTLLDGSLTIAPGGRVEGRAIVVGGALDVRRGAALAGPVTHLGPSWPLPEGAGAVAVVGALVVGRLVLVGVVLAAARLLARARATAPLAAELRAFPLRTLLVGLIGGLGVGAVTVLLALTVLGLVAALALCGLVLTAGVVGLAMLLEHAESRETVERLLAVVLVVPLLGEAAGALAVVAGLGAFLRRSLGGPTPVGLRSSSAR